ncbi:MAG: spermidine/putrescine transport system ATP-binding protein [Tepidanaerobacteraceae bacterium]|nr:spermidine/putrescine transport system ATP-binding protein [Tepidanaerobacteraceae bacterium]
MPNQLSGGQKQRVAIARAIVNNPKVLLLDEPLGALDMKLRKKMQVELKHMQRRLGITFIYVTHDQEEALTMSDRIAVMNGGKLEQVGTPDEIYEKPASSFVADFIGETNLFEAKVNKTIDNVAFLDIDCEGEIQIDKKTLIAGESVYIAIRPERIVLSKEPLEGYISLSGRMKERIYVGSNLKTIVKLKNGKEVVVNEPVSNTADFNETQDLYVCWKAEWMVVLNK